MHHTVFLSIGTNLGERAKNLQRALEGLAGFCRMEATSSLYETDPWGYTDQPAFYNLAVRVQTALEPDGLLKALKALEAEIGRVPGFLYGPRLIDLDILTYDDLQLAIPGLTIPHPMLAERAFVLVPLAEIAPLLLVPGLNETVQELLDKLDCAGIRKVMEA